MCSSETKDSNFVVQFSLKGWKLGHKWKQHGPQTEPMRQKLWCANYYPPCKGSPAMSSTSAHSTLFFSVTLTTWASNIREFCCLHELLGVFFPFETAQKFSPIFFCQLSIMALASIMQSLSTMVSSVDNHTWSLTTAGIVSVGRVGDGSHLVVILFIVVKVKWSCCWDGRQIYLHPTTKRKKL